jgi:hypothetical protein
MESRETQPSKYTPQLQSSEGRGDDVCPPSRVDGRETRFHASIDDALYPSNNLPFDFPVLHEWIQLLYIQIAITI